MVFGARETAAPQPSLGFRETGPKKGKNTVSGSALGENALLSDQRRMARLVRADRKATVTQITARYSRGMQKTISERTTRRTLTQMGYSNRRHQVSLLSAKSRKLRLQWAQAHQNWTKEDWLESCLLPVPRASKPIPLWWVRKGAVSPSDVTFQRDRSRGFWGCRYNPLSLWKLWEKHSHQDDSVASGVCHLLRSFDVVRQHQEQCWSTRGRGCVFPQPFEEIEAGGYGTKNHERLTFCWRCGEWQFHTWC